MAYLVIKLLLLAVVWGNILGQDKNTLIDKDNEENMGKRNKSTSLETQKMEPIPKLICPKTKSSFQPLFALNCKSTKECTQWRKNLMCCNGRCVKPIPTPPPEIVHTPALFGLVERVCPSELIPEILEIKECQTDKECAPRICCSEQLRNGETKGYCRTARPKLDKLPAFKQLMEPLKLFLSYMQCTPPPPPILDIFPKTCNSPLDCFPNLCCQERGRRFCRPPKRSLLSLIAIVGQRLVPRDLAKELILRVAS